MYCYFVPLEFGIIVVGKIIGGNRFYHASMLTGLIIASAFCNIVYYSIFPCMLKIGPFMTFWEIVLFEGA